MPAPTLSAEPLAQSKPASEAVAAVSSKPRSKPQTFYRYEDDSGKVHIVDSRDKLPPSERDTAESVDLDGAPTLETTSAATGVPLAGSASSGSTALNPKEAATEAVRQHAERVIEQLPPELQPAHFDATSFILGFGAAGTLAAAAFLLAKGSKLVLKLVAGAALIALLAGAYLGILRRQMLGAKGGLIETPGQLVEDARRAVRAAEERQQKQQKMLDEALGTGGKP